MNYILVPSYTLLLPITYQISQKFILLMYLDCVCVCVVSAAAILKGASTLREEEETNF